MNTTDGAALRRDLGLQIAVAVVVGNVIGSGIFLKPGNIASEAGDFGLILPVWVFGGVLCLLGALCFAELATMLPRAGGLYVYLGKAYGRPVAFLFGWTEVIFAKPASIGALSVAFVGSLGKAIRWELPEWMLVLLATALVVLMAWINFMGVLWGGRMQWVTTILKAGFLALVGVVPFLLTPFLAEGVAASNYATVAAPRQTDLFSQIGVVLLAVMWAYNGWHGITPLAEEVRDPQRNIPLALFAGIGILITLYLAANLAYHGVLTMTEMKESGDFAAQNMLGKLFGQTGVAAVSAVIMCSTFGAINSNLLQAPRVSFAMGRDETFFRTIGSVHAKYRTPAAAIVLMAGMTIALITAISLAKRFMAEVDASGYEWELSRRIVDSLQRDNLFDLLTNFAIFSASIFYFLGVLAVFVLRYRFPDLPRPYRTWGYPLTPLLFLVVYVWFLSQIYLSKPLESRTSLLLIGIGIPFYMVFRWHTGRTRREPAS